MNNWNIVCIQNFINGLEENSIPKAALIRIQSGFSNKRIIEDFQAMTIKAEIVYQGIKPFFIVPYCNLSLNIGLAHGLVLSQVVYPETGYFANPENTLDDAYLQLSCCFDEPFRKYLSKQQINILKGEVK